MTQLSSEEVKLQNLMHQHSLRDAIFSSLAEGVFCLSESGEILQINKSAKLILGLNLTQDYIGAQLEDIILDVNAFEEFDIALGAENYYEEDIKLETAERLVYLSLRVTPLKMPSGELLGSLFVINDLTKLRKLEKYRKHFVANVSHELRTPLTAIKGFVETLLDGALDDREDSLKFLGIILRQVNRLNTLIESLLTLSKMDQEDQGRSSSFLLEKTETSLKPLLESAIQICLSKADKKSIPIHLQVDENLPVFCHPSLLEQALVSLIDNAISYCPEKLPVYVSAQINKNWLHLSVRDCGPGIPAKHQDRIFERFYRIDKGRSRYLGKGGTGLGLAIVKNIALAHGGKVSIISEVDKGSEFIFSLPLTGQEERSV